MSVNSSVDKWCYGCKEYDIEHHCCHRFSDVIRNTVKEWEEEEKIVRCRDCKYYVNLWENITEYVCRHPKLEFDIECSDHWVAVNEYDFCSYGERREYGGKQMGL